METWGMAETHWWGHGEGFGGIWGGLGELGRMHIPSPGPLEDEAAGTSRHEGWPRSILGYRTSRGVAAPRPKGWHVSKDSQVEDYSLQLAGICLSAG